MQNKLMQRWRRLMEPQAPAAACAALLLVLLPLFVRDGFFDINRIKVNVVLFFVPPLSVWMLACMLMQERPRDLLGVHRNVKGMLASLGLFLLALIISSARQGFSQEVLYGTKGRFCGLMLLLCCGLAFCVIALGGLSGRGLVAAAVTAASLVSLLGILNAGGLDPFRFYDRIKRSQISIFLSTIGNVDFFGAYLAMLYPLAASQAILCGRKSARMYYGVCACVIACGVAVSRSDSAFFALQLASLALVALSGDSYRAMRHALWLWAFALAALPVMRPVLERGFWEIYYTGLFRVLCDSGMIAVPMMLLLSGGAICAYAEKKKRAAPGRRKLILAAAVLLALLFTVFAGLAAYCTWIRPDTELGAAESFLRLGDEWGTRRGFVYRCALKAYADFPLSDKLFGGGVDSAARLLAPYFDNEAMLKYGTFNDAHCQPLQFLLTAGAAGAAGYAALYILTLRACLRNAQGDALLAGVGAALSGFFVIAMLGVTQPIVVITYLSLAALAASRLNHLAKGEKSHES